MEKLKITYHMKRGKWESAESYIEIPCSKEKYCELMKADRFDKWHTEEQFTGLNIILEGICKLQGYKLEGYQFEKGGEK